MTQRFYLLYHFITNLCILFSPKKRLYLLYHFIRNLCIKFFPKKRSYLLYHFIRKVCINFFPKNHLAYEDEEEFFPLLKFKKVSQLKLIDCTCMPDFRHIPRFVLGFIMSIQQLILRNLKNLTNQ